MRLLEQNQPIVPWFQSFPHTRNDSIHVDRSSQFSVLLTHRKWEEVQRFPVEYLEEIVFVRKMFNRIVLHRAPWINICRPWTDDDSYLRIRAASSNNADAWFTRSNARGMSTRNKSSGLFEHVSWPTWTRLSTADLTTWTDLERSGRRLLSSVDSSWRIINRETWKRFFAHSNRQIHTHTHLLSNGFENTFNRSRMKHWHSYNRMCISISIWKQKEEEVDER